MDYQFLDFSMKAGNIALTAGIGFYVWLTNRNRVTHERITALQDSTAKAMKEIKTEATHNVETLRADFDDRLDKHGVQLAHLEEAGKHAITKEDLALIYERVNEVATSLSQLKGEFSGHNNTLKLIHEHMLKGGK